jgi:hypothetical protein
MRSFAILFGAILFMSALFVPALAATTKPNPSECKAAADVTLRYWQAKQAKGLDEPGSKAAATMTEKAGTLAATLAEIPYTTETRREFENLVPDLRDIFVVRCGIHWPPA